MQGRTLVLLIFSTNVCATALPKRNKAVDPNGLLWKGGLSGVNGIGSIAISNWLRSICPQNGQFYHDCLPEAKTLNCVTKKLHPPGNVVVARGLEFTGVHEAQRLKRNLDCDIPINPVFQRSPKDVELLYEFLLGGLNIDDNFKCTLKDEELASMRAGKKFNVIINNIIPKNITDIRRLTYRLSKYSGQLKPVDFERMLLTLLFTVYRASRYQGHQQDTWAEALVNIFQALRHDLLL